jgi:alkanesulfonate monooxygenase SsuD/methylene tetrahydromethanopterin reductase-like flavin-dependent oxidoreductase (luciferase family)
VVESKLAAAVIGGPATILEKLRAFQRATEADELMFTTDAYQHADRLRSLELAAEAIRAC